MNKAKTFAPNVFVLIGLMWMVLGIFGSANRATYISLGVVFFVLGLGLKRRSGKRS
jgi:hypothetical protein